MLRDDIGMIIHQKDEVCILLMIHMPNDIDKSQEAIIVVHGDILRQM